MKTRSSRPLSLLSFAATLALGTAAALAQTAAPPASTHEHGGMPMGDMGGKGMGHGDHSGMMGDHMQHMQQMRQMMHEMMAKMAEHADDRIASLKTDLKITEAQAPQWKSFADALQSAAKSMEGMQHHMMQPAASAAANAPSGDTNYPDAAAIKKTGPGPAMSGAGKSLPVRLEAHEKMLTQHLATLQAIKAALEPLYASFNDEQKKIADGLMVGPMGVM